MARSASGPLAVPQWRFEVATPELDRAEQQWWEDYGDLEERYCWVQTDWVQQFLRGRYLRDILRGLGPSHSVLELGCGTGWLTFRLARAGAAVVTGVDSSPSQIARARAAAEELGLGDRVQFEVGDAGHLACAARRFDLVVMHAFLHHLTAAEIREVLAIAADLLNRGGRLVALEPTCFPEGRTDKPKVLRMIGSRQDLPMDLARRGIHRVADSEGEVRADLANRWAGALPFGPAPKDRRSSPRSCPVSSTREVHDPPTLGRTLLCSPGGAGNPRRTALTAAPLGGAPASHGLAGPSARPPAHADGAAP